MYTIDAHNYIHIHVYRVIFEEYSR